MLLIIWQISEEIHRDSTSLPFPRDSITIQPGETERKPRQNATTLFAIAAKPLFRGGSSSNSLPFACSSTVKLLSWWLANLSPQKKKPQTSVVLFSLFFSFFFKGSLIVLIQMYWINFYYSKFRISKRNAVFCVAFIDDVTSFFFFLKVNIYFGARRGEVWKIRGRNLFPECFRTKEKSMKKYIRVIIVKRRSSRRVVKFLDKNLRTIRINIVKFCERGGKSRLWIREENSIYSLLVWYSILESSKLCDVAK